MPSRTLAAALVVLALGAGVSACGGDDEKAAPKPTGTPTAEVTGPGADKDENFATGKTFFEALASNDPAQLRRVEDLVAPDSGAEGYLDALIAALDDAKKPTPALELRTPAEGVYRLCSTSGKGCSELT